MKKTENIEIKNLQINELWQRIKKARKDLADLLMDKNMGQLKDVKAVWKKKKDLAQMLTILRQKQLLVELESVNQSISESEKEKMKNVKKGGKK